MTHDDWATEMRRRYTVLKPVQMLAAHWVDDGIIGRLPADPEARHQRGAPDPASVAAISRVATSRDLFAPMTGSHLPTSVQPSVEGHTISIERWTGSVTTSSDQVNRVADSETSDRLAGRLPSSISMYGSAARYRSVPTSAANPTVTTPIVEPSTSSMAARRTTSVGSGVHLRMTHPEYDEERPDDTRLISWSEHPDEPEGTQPRRPEEREGSLSDLGAARSV